MVHQEIITEKRVRTMRVGKKPEVDSKAKGRVNVAPHVRMIKGKPVFVAGYTYRRK